MTIEEIRKELVFHIEMLAAAYAKATNIPPLECELVMEMLPDKVIFYFRKKTNE